MSQALTAARPYARAACATGGDEGNLAAWSQALGFAAHAAAEDPGAATTLARYRRWRESDAALAAESLDLIDALFRTDTPGIGWLRRGGMAWVDRLAPLKRRLALHACGWAGRVPPLAQRLPAQRSMR